MRTVGAARTTRRAVAVTLLGLAILLASAVLGCSASVPSGPGTSGSQVSPPTPTPGPSALLTIAADAASVTEGTSVGFTITADSAPSSSITVQVSVTGTGEHLAGTTPTEVTLLSGSTTAWVVLQTKNDGGDASNGSVTVTVEPGAGYDVGSPSSASVPILDIPDLTITADAASVTEGTDVGFTITADTAPSSSITVQVSVTGTGEHLAGTTPTEVTLSSGSTTAWVVLQTKDDGADASNGSVTVTIEPGAGYDVGSPSSASVTVTDGDALAPNLTITADAASVTEGTSVGFTITADTAPSSSITVQVSVTGTGEHLAGTTPTEVTLSSGSTTAWVVLQTKDDGADASNGSVTVTIEPGAGYDVGSPSSASVTVTDGDAVAPNLTITADAASVTEGTSVGFTITADTAPSSSITVQVSVTGTGEHLAGTTPTEVTLSSGSTTAWVVLQTKDDGADASNGSVTVTIEPGAGYDVGSPSSASVTVTDGDALAPNLTITANAASVTEGTSVGFTITADTAPSSSITVQVSVTGTGEHLAGTTPTEVTLSSGSTTAWVVLQTKDDGADASNGSVTVTIEPGAGYDVGSPSSASVTVTDGDAVAPNLTITADAASVTEGTSVGFTITADTAPSSSITVQVSVTGTGEHLAGTTPTEVTLSSGSTTAWVVLQTKNDGGDASNGSVTVTIEPGAGYNVGSPSSASVPVTDGDAVAPNLTITANAASVTEGTSVGFTITADTAPSSSITVQVSVTGTGEHLAGTTPTEVTLLSGSTTAWVVLQTKNDGGDASNGSVTVTSSRDREARTVRRGRRARHPPACRSWTSRNLTITADAASVTEGTDVGFTITADTAPSSSITVQVSVTGTGEHLAGTTPTEVTLSSGSTTAWVVLQTKNDGGDASNGSVTVTIEPGAGYNVGSPSSASVPVTDGDAVAPNLTITANAASVTEGTSVGFTITADTAPSSSITVQVSVTGTGEHLAGTTPTEVTLLSGSTTAWVVLQTKNDGGDASNGSVTVTIEPGAGYDVGSPSSASVTVTDILI